MGLAVLVTWYYGIGQSGFDNACGRPPLLFDVVYPQCGTGRLENALQRKFSSAYLYL